MPRNPRKPCGRKKGRRRLIGFLRKGSRHEKKLQLIADEATVNGVADEQCESANHSSNEEGFTGFDFVDKQPLTVLSLFDGISVGRFCLDKLAICVQAYYSSEINPKALALQECKFGDRVIPVGCVKGLTREVLASLGKIDLLLGGSPCQDFSLVNPHRQGLVGVNGSLFWEYVRVLRQMQEAAVGERREFFWLFENTQCMERATLAQISRALKCDPVLIDAAQYGKMKRARYFWGNIPGMFDSRTQSSCCEELDDILCPNRKGAVKILPTLTTTFHSQLTGKAKIMPVLHRGNPCKLYVIEEEKAFGLPESYTDGADLSIKDRWALLGKAWSADVVTDIMRPLKKVFKTFED